MTGKGLSYDSDGLSDIFNTKMADRKNGTTMNFKPSLFETASSRKVNYRWTSVAEDGERLFTFSDADGMPCVETLTLCTTTKKMTINDVDCTEPRMVKSHSKQEQLLQTRRSLVHADEEVFGSSKETLRLSTSRMPPVRIQDNV